MPPCNCHPPFPRPEPFSPLPRPGKIPDWGKWIRDRLAEKGALLVFPTRASFPGAGEWPNMYLDQETGAVYRWDRTDYAVLFDPREGNDVLVYDSVAAFPDEGEQGKLYIAANTGSLYRWGGEGYVALLEGKADKAVPQAAGNFAALDGSGNLTDSGKKPADFATAAQGAKADTAVQPPELVGFVDGAEYDAEYGDEGKPTILLKHGSTVVATVDATDFVIDGMVEDVKIEGGNLVIVFNTAAGGREIDIPLTDIFDPANYYDKDAVDKKLDKKRDKTDLVVYEEGLVWRIQNVRPGQGNPDSIDGVYDQVAGNTGVWQKRGSSSYFIEALPEGRYRLKGGSSTFPEIATWAGTTATDVGGQQKGGPSFAPIVIWTCTFDVAASAAPVPGTDTLAKKSELDRAKLVYAECTTDQGVAAKAATTPGHDFVAEEGRIAVVHFARFCAGGSPTLSIDGSDPMPIYQKLEESGTKYPAGLFAWGNGDVIQLRLFSWGWLILGPVVADPNQLGVARLRNGLDDDDPLAAVNQRVLKAAFDRKLDAAEGVLNALGYVYSDWDMSAFPAAFQSSQPQTYHNEVTDKYAWVILTGGVVVSDEKYDTEADALAALSITMRGPQLPDGAVATRTRTATSYRLGTAGGPNSGKPLQPAGDYATKASPATAGNLAALDANGGIVDSGVKASDKRDKTDNFTIYGDAAYKTWIISGGTGDNEAIYSRGTYTYRGSDGTWVRDEFRAIRRKSGTANTFQLVANPGQQSEGVIVEFDGFGQHSVDLDYAGMQSTGVSIGSSDPDTLARNSDVENNAGAIEYLRAAKADKPATFTTGNLASLDENGNLEDSGKSLDDIRRYTDNEVVKALKPTHVYNAGASDRTDDKGGLATVDPGQSVPAVYTINGNVFEYYGFQYYQSSVQRHMFKKWPNNYITYEPNSGLVTNLDNYDGGWHDEELATIEAGLDPRVSGLRMPDLNGVTVHGCGTGRLAYTPKEAAFAAPYAHFALEEAPTRAIAASTAYAVGDLLGDGGRAYRCISAYMSAAAPDTVAPSSDTTHWAEVPVLRQFRSLQDDQVGTVVAEWTMRGSEDRPFIWRDAEGQWRNDNNNILRGPHFVEAYQQDGQTYYRDRMTGQAPVYSFWTYEGAELVNRGQAAAPNLDLYIAEAGVQFYVSARTDSDRFARASEVNARLDSSATGFAEFDPLETYQAGATVTHEGRAYISTTAHSGPWDATHFSETPVVVNRTAASGGVAVGEGAKATNDGTAAGRGAEANATGSVATGASAFVSNTSDKGVAVGPDAKVYAQHGTAVGHAAEVSAEKGTAIGYNAKVAANKTGAVQLGAGTNQQAYSLQFRSTTVVNTDGKIPSANLDKAIPSLTGETMPDVPTQNELNAAVKKIFRALGGTIV